MRLQADEPRMAAPGGLADDVAIAAKGGFGQFNDPGQVQVRQPQGVTVEHTFVLVEQAAVIPVQRLELVDGRVQGCGARRVEHAWQQYEAIPVQRRKILGRRLG
ncbi:hypothetical protein D3C71_1898280 [compost metagenome]